MKWALVAVMVGATTAGEVMQAAGMRRHGEIRDFRPGAIGRALAGLARNRFVIGAVAAMAVSFFAFMKLLSMTDLSFAVPVSAITYVMETVLAKYLLKERVNGLRWAGAVLVRQTVRTCGINGLALTKLDILDGFDAIEVCVGYMLDGKEIDHLPAGEGAQARVVPVYETIEGWKEPTANARSWANLPAQAIKYVRRVEELVGCPIALLSTSPEREDTILVQNPFEA